MSRYRRIVLHAGLSKTGSTSIQRNCARHRQWLADHGVDFPVISYRGDPFPNHGIPLVTALTDKPQRYILGIRRRYGDDLAALADSCRMQLTAALERPRGDVLLLSSELVENFVARDMRALREWLEPRARSLEVVAYFRSPQSGLESLLQERLKAGALLEPEELVGRVRQKYENLHSVFGDVLVPLSYHESVMAPQGVVGSFLARLGLPGSEIRELQMERSNARMSMESFRLMRAINQRLPKNAQAEHGVARAPRDLNALLAISGAPFQLTGFADSAVYRACLEEAAWLEPRLGFVFPEAEARSPAPQWQPPTLAALPGALERLPVPAFRRAAADFLREEALALAQSRPDTADELRRIAAAFGGDPFSPAAD
ncbi:MAG: hypothetical protein U5K56_16940 [Halioglobus sp.]|nr:hypothetical protein [Halioglobus sp.]